LDDDETDWTLEVERALAEKYHWNLHDLDRTDIESLFPFFFHLARGNQAKQAPTQRTTCDQAEWI